MNRQIRREYAVKKKIEEEMYRVMTDIQIPEPSEDQIKQYLQTNWGEHLWLCRSPILDREYAAQLWESEDEEGEWKVQGKKGKGKEQATSWRVPTTDSGNVALTSPSSNPHRPRYIATRTTKRAEEEEEAGRATDSTKFVLVRQPKRTRSVPGNGCSSSSLSLVLATRSLRFPTGNRPFVELQDSSAVWGMSLEERQRLAEHWEEEMRRLAYHSYLRRVQELAGPVRWGMRKV
jgi:hypothetical protein